MIMDKKNLTIGFIGFGNMASAIAEGFLQAGVLQPDQIVAADPKQDALEKRAKEMGIQAMSSNQAAIEAADLVFLGFKPQQFPDLMPELKESLEGKLVLSMAAGIKQKDLAQWLTGEFAAFIPNTPIAVGEGATILEETNSLSPETEALFMELFTAVGSVEKVPSENMEIAMVISSCGPAFAAMFTEALGDAAVKYGLNRQTAYQLAGQMLAGAGKLAVETGDHPGVLKDRVTSPKGATIKGVTSLEKSGFRGSLIEAVDAIQRD